MTGLYAIYFQSLVLERQSKWQQAEDLWKDAVKLRETLMLSDNYWDAVKEFAAFYARHGDFHQAATLAAQAEAGTTGKTLRPEAAVPTQIDSRPRIATHSQYRIESDAAMKEILAIDKWQTDGPDAAAPLLPDLMKSENGFGLDAGSDSDRAQLLTWFERRVFLHMSILLDGNPSQDRVNKAYELLSNVKGRFFAATIESARRLESERGNPHVSGGKYHLLDELADARTAHARMFLASALDGKQFNGLEFAAGENQERALVEAIISDGNAVGATYSRFSLSSLAGIVPANGALADMVVWQRIGRTGNTAPPAEYGAFVARNGQPVRYVAFGPAADIDNDITVLNARVLGNRVRGVRLPQQTASVNSDEVQQRLKSLYSKVIAPMEKSLQGAQNILIVPDGKLTLAPVGGFMDPAGHYFLESHTITYLSSWRDIIRPTGYDPGQSSLPVVIANPDFDSTFGEPAGAPGPDRLKFNALAGAELEARDVQKALNLPAGRVLTGKMAREEIVRSLVSPEILHFATHSVPYLHWQTPVTSYDFFEFPQSSGTEDPLLQSVVALAGANLPHTGAEDGLLTGLEIASLHLAATRLVVLSSCESAQGTPLDGQGVLGMRAAVSMSGAEMLVMSLWPVDDEAGRQFMQFFYSHLAAGPAEAVRLAQIDLRTKTEFKDPYYWAGYSASGNSHAGERKPPPPLDNHETFAPPNCFEISSHHDDGSGLMRYFDTVRVTTTGIVRRQQTDSATATYELIGPGTDVVDHSGISINHGPQAQNPDVMRASLMEWPITLTIERQKDSSSLSIRVRNPPTPPQVLITLKGGPGLFPTFDIPDTLPPLAAYTQSTLVSGRAEGVIDKIGFCAARRSAPVAPEGPRHFRPDDEQSPPDTFHEMPQSSKRISSLPATRRSAILRQHSSA